MSKYEYIVVSREHWILSGRLSEGIQTQASAGAVWPRLAKVQALGRDGLSSSEMALAPVAWILNGFILVARVRNGAITCGACQLFISKRR
jgi:hypothetical protein